MAHVTSDASDQSQPLPTPRALLTSLLKTLFNSPPSPPPFKSDVTQPSTRNPSHSAVTGGQDAENQTNPLKSLSANQRALLATLHVLFPPPMLLQALDLLDRDLVRRLVWECDEAGDGDGDGEAVRADVEAGKRYGRDADQEGSRSRAMTRHEREGDETGRESRDERAVLPSRETSKLAPESPSERRVQRAVHASSLNQQDTPLQTQVEGQGQGQNQRDCSPGTHRSTHRRSKRRRRSGRTLYQVRSSQQRQRSRFKDLSHSHSHHGSGTPGGSSASASASAAWGEERIYTVHVEAWNCSCAAFAFSAFPYQSTSSRGNRPWGNVRSDLDGDNGGGDEIRGEGSEGFRGYVYSRQKGRPEQQNATQREKSKEEGEKDEEEEEEWQFGGLSSDGKVDGSDGDGNGGVPVCKHLLACLLAERWDILRGFADEKIVRREEVAGLVVEG